MPKGKTPSLLNGNAGKPNRVVAGRKRECTRCHGAIVKGELCFEVPHPGFAQGWETYCCDCFANVLDQTKKDLDAHFAALQEARAGS